MLELGWARTVHAHYQCRAELGSWQGDMGCGFLPEEPRCAIFTSRRVVVDWWWWRRSERRVVPGPRPLGARCSAPGPAPGFSSAAAREMRFHTRAWPRDDSRIPSLWAEIRSQLRCGGYRVLTHRSWGSLRSCWRKPARHAQGAGAEAGRTASEPGRAGRTLGLCSTANIPEFTNAGCVSRFTALAKASVLASTLNIVKHGGLSYFALIGKINF